jgi:hypothetical protein
MCRDSQARATWRPPVTGTAALSLASERLRDDRRARIGAGCLWSRQTARGGEVHPQGQQQVWGPSVHACVLPANRFFERDEVGGRGSGGANALSVAAHQMRGTFRRDRHSTLRLTCRATTCSPVFSKRGSRRLKGVRRSSRRWRGCSRRSLPRVAATGVPRLTRARAT